jgi:hypothetical protein
MLTIRQNQYAVINLQRVLCDPSLFVTHARTYHPGPCHGLDDDALTVQVIDILKIAAGKGISATRDLLTFLDLAMIFGLDWSAQLQWLNRGLQESAGGEISDRLRRLRLEAIYRFEAESAAR